MQKKLFPQSKNKIRAVIFVLAFFAILFIPKNSFAAITTGSLNYVDGSSLCPGNQVMFGQGYNYGYSTYNWCKDVYKDGVQATRSYFYTAITENDGIVDDGVSHTNYCPYGKFYVGSSIIPVAVNVYGWHEHSRYGLISWDPRYPNGFGSNYWGYMTESGQWVPALNPFNLSYYSTWYLGRYTGYYYYGYFYYRDYGWYRTIRNMPVGMCDVLNSGSGRIIWNNAFYSYYEYAYDSDHHLSYWYDHCGHGTNNLVVGFGSYPSGFMCGTPMYQCVAGTSWSPDPGAYCSNIPVTQYDDCGNARTVYGTKPCPRVDIKAKKNSNDPFGVDGPLTISAGTSATILWSSINVISATCSVAPNGWTGASNAGISTGDLNTNTTYTLTCRGIDGTPVQDSVTVNVEYRNFSGFFMSNNISFQNSSKIKFSPDQNVINNPPPGFNDIFAPVWKELIP